MYERKTALSSLDKKRFQESHSAVKQQNINKTGNSCNSCGVCRSLSSPRLSSQVVMRVIADARTAGRVSCAVSMLQQNYGNRFTTGVLASTIQKKCDCGGSCSKCGDKQGEAVGETDRISTSIMRMNTPVVNRKEIDTIRAAGKGETEETLTVDPVTIKRKNISLKGEDKYGHWWTEIDGTESYGWWPKTGVGLKQTLFGTDGELNGQTTFGGTPTKDPHHGDAAEETWKPKAIYKFKTGEDRTAVINTKNDEIRTCIRNFAKGYSGEWRWTFGWGQNCHTFQEAMMKNCGLKEP